MTSLREQKLSEPGVPSVLADAAVLGAEKRAKTRKEHAPSVLLAGEPVSRMAVVFACWMAAGAFAFWMAAAKKEKAKMYAASAQATS